MSTYVYIAIGIVVIAYLVIRIFKRAAGMPILKVKIGSTDGSNYNVEFEKLHPEVKDIEYVRLLLNFIAKTLFIIEKKHDYVSGEIFAFINGIVVTRMRSGEILENTLGEITIEEGTAGGRIIEGILYFKDIQTRNIMTRLPTEWFEYQLAHSVMALTKVIVDKLDDSHLTILKDSLVFMAKAYGQSNMDPKKMQTMVSLPNEAFVFRNT